MLTKSYLVFGFVLMFEIKLKIEWQRDVMSLSDPLRSL